MGEGKTKIYKFKRHMQHYWQLNNINECKWTRTVVFVTYFRSLLYIRCISSINMTIPMYIYYESQSFIFFFCVFSCDMELIFTKPTTETKLHGYHQNPKLLIKTEKKKRKIQRTWENQTPEGHRNLLRLLPEKTKHQNITIIPYQPHTQQKKKNTYYHLGCRRTGRLGRRRTGGLGSPENRRPWVAGKQDAFGPGWVAGYL